MSKIVEKAIKIDNGNLDIFLKEHGEIKYSIVNGTTFLRLGPDTSLICIVIFNKEILYLEYKYNNHIYRYEKKI